VETARYTPVGLHERKICHRHPVLRKPPATTPSRLRRGRRCAPRGVGAVKQLATQGPDPPRNRRAAVPRQANRRNPPHPRLRQTRGEGPRRTFRGPGGRASRLSSTRASVCSVGAAGGKPSIISSWQGCRRRSRSPSCATPSVRRWPATTCRSGHPCVDGPRRPGNHAAVHALRARRPRGGDHRVGLRAGSQSGYEFERCGTNCGQLRPDRSRI